MKFDAEVQLDHFAELLSLDIPVTRIAERMGLSKARGFALLKKLRDRLGWQAS